MTQPMLVLASTSKIRHTILKNAGLNHRVIQPTLDEFAVKRANKNSDAKSLAITLATLKALSISHQSDFILGADQILEYNGELYDKPNSLGEAEQHLSILQGKTHYLHSALAITQYGKKLWEIVETASLTMRPLSAASIKSYVAQTDDRILQCVGAYQLEGRGVQLFQEIKGDYFTILGLPLLPLLEISRRLGLLEP